MHPFVPARSLRADTSFANFRVYNNTIELGARLSCSLLFIVQKLRTTRVRTGQVVSFLSPKLQLFHSPFHSFVFLSFKNPSYIIFLFSRNSHMAQLESGRNVFFSFSDYYKFSHEARYTLFKNRTFLLAFGGRFSLWFSHDLRCSSSRPITLQFRSFHTVPYTVLSPHSCIQPAFATCLCPLSPTCLPFIDPVFHVTFVTYHNFLPLRCSKFGGVKTWLMS